MVLQFLCILWEISIIFTESHNMSEILCKSALTFMHIGCIVSIVSRS